MENNEHQAAEAKLATMSTAAITQEICSRSEEERRTAFLILGNALEEEVTEAK